MRREGEGIVARNRSRSGRSAATEGRRSGGGGGGGREVEGFAMQGEVDRRLLEQFMRLSC